MERKHGECKAFMFCLCILSTYTEKNFRKVRSNVFYYDQNHHEHEKEKSLEKKRKAKQRSRK